MFNVSDGGATAGNVSWGRALSLGTSDAVYFEDNEILCDTSCGSPVMFCDVTDGGRITIRHNKIRNHYIGGHDASSVNRGIMQLEAYNNNIEGTGYQGTALIGLRGGTGVIYNNTLKHSEANSANAFYSSERPYGLTMTNYRSDSCSSTSWLWVNKCDASGSQVKGFLGANCNIFRFAMYKRNGM